MSDWLILIAWSTIWGYFMPQGEGIVYIVYIYILCSFLYFLYTVIWFQVFLANTNNFQTDLFDP